MKNKKLFLPTIILISAVVLTIISTLVFSIALKPTVTEGEFPFSITYELDGEQVTINDVYKTRFVRDDDYLKTKGREYVGEIGKMGEDNTYYTLKSNEQGRIELHTRFYADYMMGDAQYDYFDTFEPIIYYYDSNETEYLDEETLAQQGVKLIDFEYPEPIQNSLVFSHIAIPYVEVILPSIIIAFLAMIATLIFVKKDADYVRNPLNIITIIFNYLISFTALPFFTICGYLLAALGDVGDVLNLLFFLLPSVTILFVTLSIALRRKLYGKSALIVQFISPGIFALIMFIGTCLGLA